MQKNRKGQMAYLNGIAYSLVLFAIIIGLGLIVIAKMGDQVVGCSDGLVSAGVTGEAGWLNSSGYTLANSNAYGFTNLIVTDVFNRTDGTQIALGNVTYTLAGVVFNDSAVVYPNATFNYTYTWDNTHTWNATLQKCVNVTNGDPQTGVGNSYTTIAYVATQMGSTGLAGWIPVVIVVLIAGLVLALFGRKKEY